MNLFSYSSIAFSTALTNSTFLLLFSSFFILDSLSICEMNHNQKINIYIYIRFKSTRELGNPIAITNFEIIKVIAKTENKIESKLRIAKDSLIKIILLLLFLSCLRIIQSQTINLFMQFLYLLITMKKIA